MIIESHRFEQHWLNPNSVTIPQVVSAFYSDDDNILSSLHPGGTNVGLADGSVRFLPESFSVDDLKTLLTIDAKDEIGYEDW